MITVAAFGTFDILHPGHLSYLRFCRKKGSRLIVIVTPDAAVMRRKDHAPVFNQHDRIKMVSALLLIDRAVVGDSDDSWHVLKKIRPDIICLGYDQKKAHASLMKSLSYITIGSPPIVFASSFRPKKYHSRILRSSAHGASLLPKP